MSHFDGTAELDPTKHRALFRLIEHLGAIVKAGCLAPAEQTVPQRDPVQHAPEGQVVPWQHRDPAHRCPAAATVAMLVVRGRRPDLGLRRDDLGHPTPARLVGIG